MKLNESGGHKGPGRQETLPARCGVRLAELHDYLPTITTIVFVVDIVIILVCIPWILIIKRDSTAAMAWSLIVFLLPIIGSLLFVLFGYTRVHRPLRKKRHHRAKFKARRPDSPREPGQREPQPDPTWQDLGNLAVRLGCQAQGDGPTDQQCTRDGDTAAKPGGIGRAGDSRGVHQILL